MAKQPEKRVPADDRETVVPSAADTASTGGPETTATSAADAAEPDAETAPEPAPFFVSTAGKPPSLLDLNRRHAEVTGPAGGAHDDAAYRAAIAAVAKAFGRKLPV